MANTLTGLVPTLYEALNVISREMVGFIPAVRRDTNADRAAVNQVVRVPLAEAGTLEAITPAATPANSGDTTVDYADVAITSAYASPIRWNGEEERAVGTTGTYNRILADQFVDAMRKLVNQVEIDTFMAGYKAASRAYGSAGTAPFVRTPSATRSIHSRATSACPPRSSAATRAAVDSSGSPFPARSRTPISQPSCARRQSTASGRAIFGE